MKDEAPYEPDRVEGTPHPRHAARLFGQAEAERALREAYDRDRLHHAWLLTGPRGIGKATLAWRFARFLIATPPGAAPPEAAPPGVRGGLDIAPDHPVAARIAALSEPRLFLMRPSLSETGVPRRDITVDVARGVRDFLHLSAADGGARVVIVDAADQLNLQAANALLKLVEEPPARTVFLLVAHAPARLLPTIRSRCRTLALRPLAGPDLERALGDAGLDPGIDAAALAQLARGSVGEAARLLQNDGPALYAALVALAGTVPDMDRGKLLNLTAGLGGAAGRERMDTLSRLIDLVLARLARTGAGAAPEAEAVPGEARELSRLAPDAAAGRAWADLGQTVSDRIAHGRAVNLDPSGLVLDTGLRFNETGRAILRGRGQ